MSKSYLQRWRQIHKDIASLTDGSDVEGNFLVDSDSIPNSANDQYSSNHSSSTDTDSSFELDTSPERPVVSTTSENDTSFSEVSHEEQDLADSLALWIVKHKCSREGSNELLGILKKHGHGTLPSDVRTLLRTPRKCDIVPRCGGSYSYFGIESGVVRILKKYPTFLSNRNSVQLEVNIDGLPLFKSTTHQFWPILCAFDKFEPFIVALYYGKAKPTNVEEFLRDFLREYSELRRNNLTYSDKVFTVTLKVFVCDAPARSFIKCIKQHNAYYACERCVIKGSWEGRVVYSDFENHDERTEDGFKSQIYHNHQCGISPLVEHDISCINSFVLDYMHMVCLGVTKRLLMFLKSGPKKCKLSTRHLTEISASLETLKMPSDFARQPRTLSELDRWKATELRQFLLYTGPVALRGVLDSERYSHFLCLSVAMSILLMENDDRRNHYLRYAHQLLVYFIKQCPHLYGETFLVYNVHNLMHLCSDAERFQCSLNNISCFKFENYLHGIKKIVKNAKNPLAQVAKRLQEFEECKIHRIPLQPCISTRLKDSCFLSSNEEFVFVKEIWDNDRYVCDVLTHSDNFYISPCNSKLLNIAFTSRMNLECRMKKKLVEKKQLKTKVVCLDTRGGYALFPMLHGVEASC